MKLATDEGTSDNATAPAEQLMVAVTSDDVELLLGALNETFEAVEEWEFHTRVGYTLEAAQQLRAELERVAEVFATRR